MDPNPYESPRVGEPYDEKAMGESDSIRQLLTEIRDGQREMLQLQRDALLRTRKSTRFAYVFMVVPLALMAVPLYLSMTRLRPFSPTPVVAPPRALPQAVPRPTSTP